MKVPDSMKTMLNGLQPAMTMGLAMTEAMENNVEPECSGPQLTTKFSMND